MELKEFNLPIIDYGKPLKAVELAEIVFGEESIFDPNIKRCFYVAGISEQPEDHYYSLRFSTGVGKDTDVLTTPLSIPIKKITRYRTIEKYL